MARTSRSSSSLYYLCKTEHILKDQTYLSRDSDLVKTPKGVYLQMHENGLRNTDCTVSRRGCWSAVSPRFSVSTTEEALIVEMAFKFRLCSLSFLCAHVFALRKQSIVTTVNKELDEVHPKLLGCLSV